MAVGWILVYWCKSHKDPAHLFWCLFCPVSPVTGIVVLVVDDPERQSDTTTAVCATLTIYISSYVSELHGHNRNTSEHFILSLYFVFRYTVSIIMLK